MKLNRAENYEHLCHVSLDKEKYPIAFRNKVEELIDECGLSRKEAEEVVIGMKIELELYYEKGHGLFAVEADVAESGEIYSPYTGEKLETE